MEKQVKFNPIVIFSSLFSIISVIWNNWSLISSLKTFPNLPTDWNNSVQVRTFLIDLLKSTAFEELVKRASYLKWADKNFRELIIQLASNDKLWNLVWEMKTLPDEKEQQKTIRGQIRERFANRLSSNEKHALPSDDLVLESGATELRSALLAVEYTFNRQS